MNSHLQINLKEIIIFGLLGAILFAIQFLLKFIPNVELVSFLIFVYGVILGKKALYPVYIFVFLEGLIYGFGVWWIGYLYIWLPLVFISILFKKKNKKIGKITATIILGIYGCIFGFLFAFMYAIIYGISFGISYWISGLFYDFIHGISNAIIAFILYKSTVKLLNMLYDKYMKIC